VFVNNRGVIHTNTNRIACDTPLVLGSTDLHSVCGIDNHVENQQKPLLAVNGDVYIAGHIYTNGELYNKGHGECIHAGNKKVIKAEHGVFGSIDVAIQTRDKFINALEPNITADGNLHNATYYHVSAKDNIGILYVNPIKGPIIVILGNEDYCDFRPNHSITIKDVSLNYSEGSSYNVYVTVPKMKKSADQLHIQHYNSDCMIKNSPNGVYIINTSGGSVTYRFYKSKSGNDTFVIESQFVGNQRVLPGTGLVFNDASERQMQQMLARR
jgi:hypothetical protein